MEKFSNLFYDQDLDSIIKIILDNVGTNIFYENGNYLGRITIKGRFVERRSSHDFDLSSIVLPDKIVEIFKMFKFYRFKLEINKNLKNTDILLPPYGSNLPSILIVNKKLRETINSILKKYDLKLLIDAETNDIKITKLLEDILILYPYRTLYRTLSETLQRIIFYLAVIHTNKNSIIAMEEPEAHAFPFYTKYLAELIALDDSNQYFITTHNPYFLLTLIENTPKKDLAVYVTYYEDYQTKVKKLSESKLQELLDLGSSAFFNLDVLMED